MERKYQVFVSSTYSDLLDERKEVIQALLELDCIPVGMELFPAADEDQWSFIKRVIDDCDYYVLILGGRYGSCGPDGTGYTEIEYRYALEKKKPIIAFLHEHPENIPAKNSEQDTERRKKLEEFRKLVQSKLCKYWNTPAELGAVVGRSIVQLKKRSPAVGWVRADMIPDESMTTEILRLRKRIEELEDKLREARRTAPPGTESLSQGEDIFVLHYSYEHNDEHHKIVDVYEGKIETSWNTLFSIIAPHMIDEEREYDFRRRLQDYISQVSPVRRKYGTGFNKYNLSIQDADFQALKVQFHALGLIEMSIRKRSLKDSQTYWKLTPYGCDIMMRIMAIKKELSANNSLQ